MITLTDRTIPGNEREIYQVRVYDSNGQEIKGNYNPDWLFEILTNNSDQAQIITEDYLLANVPSVKLNSLTIQVIGTDD